MAIKTNKSLSKTINSILYRILVLFLTILSIFVLTPSLLLIIIPIGLYRKLIVLLARLTNPSLGKILTTSSSLFAAESLYSSQNIPTTITCINVVKGHPDIQKFREEFTQKAIQRTDPTTGQLVYPEFRQNVVRWMGYGFWKDVPNFSISDCIFSSEDPKKYPLFQGEWNKSNLLQRLQPLNALPWDPQKPLWRIAFIPYNPQDSNKPSTTSPDTLVIIFLHHCVADGYAGQKSFFQCMGIDPQEFIQKLNKRPSKIQHGLNILTGVSYALIAHYNFIYNMIKSYDSTGWEADRERFLRDDIKAYVSTSDPFPLSRLKDIKDKFRVSLSSVVLAALTAGFRKGLLDTVCKDATYLPKKIHLGMPLPVPGHPDKLRNHMTLGIISLPVGDPNPVNRLLRIHKAFERLKKSPNLLTLVYVQKIMGSFPLSILSKLRRVDNVSALLTNMPGPPYQMTVSGCPIQDIVISANAFFGKVGVGAAFTTYNQSARITVGGFASIFPTQKISDDILAVALKELDVLDSFTDV